MLEKGGGRRAGGAGGVDTAAGKVRGANKCQAHMDARERPSQGTMVALTTPNRAPERVWLRWLPQTAARARCDPLRSAGLVRIGKDNSRSARIVGVERRLRTH